MIPEQTEAHQKGLRPLNESIQRIESNSSGYNVVQMLVGKLFRKKEVKNDDTNMYPEDLHSPRRELSNGGLGTIVALWFIRELIFRVFLLGVQSSCMDRRN